MRISKSICLVLAIVFFDQAVVFCMDHVKQEETILDSRIFVPKEPNYLHCSEGRYFKQLPKQVKHVVESLKYYDEHRDRSFDQEYVLMFVGPSSTGKTEAGKAIARRLDWKFVQYNGASFGANYQNSMHNMERLLVPLMKSQYRCVVLVDDIDALQKGPQVGSDENVRGDHDAETYKGNCRLNALLDQLQEGNKVLFIGTTNDQNFITASIRQRSKVFQFKKNRDDSFGKFRNEISMYGDTLKPEASHFVENSKGRINALSFREVEKLMRAIRRTCWKRLGYSEKALLIRETDIEAALNEIEEEVALDCG